jgi:hypothetical protein
MVSIDQACYRVTRNVFGPLTYLPLFGREVASKSGIFGEHQLFIRSLTLQNTTRNTSKSLEKVRVHFRICESVN